MQNTMLTFLKESSIIAHKNGYLQQLEQLKKEVEYEKYFTHNKLWHNDAHLIITDTDATSYNTMLQEVVITPYHCEYSWLVYQLHEIYDHDEHSKYKLFPTLGVILKTLEKTHPNDLYSILHKSISLSTLWLHPKHIYGFEFAKE
ncbi:MAG: hypothetical protein ACQESH_04610 [Campylobacterota bacterium]